MDLLPAPAETMMEDVVDAGTASRPLMGERATVDMPLLILVDDDAPLRCGLQRALERRGFQVCSADNLKAGAILAHSVKPDYAVIELRLEDGSGIELLQRLRERHPIVRVVILTSYGSIATAVAAVKAGAVDYLTKPANPDDVVNALLATGTSPQPPPNPMSADRVRWEHIQCVFEQANRNVSEAARRLHMHRRSLHRILNRRAPWE